MAQTKKRHKASNDKHKIRMDNNRYSAQTYWVEEMELPKGKLLTELENLRAPLCNNYFDQIHLSEGDQMLLRNIKMPFKNLGLTWVYSLIHAI